MKYLHAVENVLHRPPCSDAEVSRRVFKSTQLHSLCRVICPLLSQLLPNRLWTLIQLLRPGADRKVHDLHRQNDVPIFNTGLLR